MVLANNEANNRGSSLDGTDQVVGDFGAPARYLNISGLSVKRKYR
jgi:hypothetical protein